MPVRRSPNAPPSRRFDEFWERYPAKQHSEEARAQWNALVSESDEPKVFACLDRYLAADRVARGVVQNPENWLSDQHRGGWSGDWPKKKLSQEEQVDSLLGQARAGL